MDLKPGELTDRLAIINIKMWHIDADIAAAEKAGDFEKAGRLAVMTRALNRERADVREEINRVHGFEETGANKIEYTVGRGEE